MRRIATVGYGISVIALIAGLVLVAQISREGQGFVDYSGYQRFVWLGACLVSVSANGLASIVWGREGQRVRLVVSVLMAMLAAILGIGLARYFGVAFSFSEPTDFAIVEDSRIAQMGSLGALLALSIAGAFMILRGPGGSGALQSRV